MLFGRSSTNLSLQHWDIPIRSSFPDLHTVKPLPLHFLRAHEKHQDSTNGYSFPVNRFLKLERSQRFQNHQIARLSCRVLHPFQHLGRFDSMLHFQEWADERMHPFADRISSSVGFPVPVVEYRTWGVPCWRRSREIERVGFGGLFSDETHRRSLIHGSFIEKVSDREKHEILS